MTRSMGSSLISKANSQNQKNGKMTSKIRANVADEILGKRGKTAEQPAPKKALDFISPKAARVSYSGTKALTRLHSYGRLTRLADSDDEFEVASKENRNSGRYELENEEDSAGSDSDVDESDEEDQDWLDGSTLLAQYRDVDSETEEERAIALVEYLQVPLQQKSHELKRDLCNALITTINDIRQAHIKVDRGADMDRGVGIIQFNDVCEKCHVDASRVQAQLKDAMADNQADVRKLFVQLKQAYDHRKQLWIGLKACLDEITELQAGVLEQLDGNMARTVAGLEKKCKLMLKDGATKDKEKLLRGVLGKL